MSTQQISTIDSNGRGAALSRTLSLLVAWFLVAVWLGVSNALGGAAGSPPLGLALAIGVPLLAFAVDGRLGAPLLPGLRRLDLATLTALQTFRVGGVFFLVAWLRGALPGGFALPAGLGDIAIGATAPFVAAALARRPTPGRRRLAVAWNLAGVTDLVLAVTMGVTHSSSSLGVLATAIKTDALGRYPFSLIPTFFVPLALMLHALSLRALAHFGSEKTSASDLP
jgi:hypothetical protein